MKDFYYKIFVIKKDTTQKDNEFHDELNGQKCKILYLEKGLPLTGYYYPNGTKDGIYYPFVTSNVLNITEKNDGNIFIETQNSYYKFERKEKIHT